MSGRFADSAITATLLVSFALWVTIHVATLFGLCKRGLVVVALGGLVLPPVAPYYAFVRGMRARAALWIVAALSYGAALWLAW